MKKTILTSFRILFVMIILTGVLYPILVTLIAQVAFPHQANGSIVSDGQNAIGSKLLAQGFTKDIYFWPRASAVNYDALASGGSNLGPTSAALQLRIEECLNSRQAGHSEAAGGRTKNLPEPGGSFASLRMTDENVADTELNAKTLEELCLASGSGLDPDISPQAAFAQIERVANARHLVAVQKEDLRKLVQQAILHRQWGIYGEERVNVLQLNLALDRLFKP